LGYKKKLTKVEILKILTQPDLSVPEIGDFDSVPEVGRPDLRQ
jgi:hypothetical protein